MTEERDSVASEPHEQELIIAAGAAFGSGGHPSTTLALQAIEGIALSRPDISSILDVGCGSGILSIAAAKHYPRAMILASDIHAESAEFVAHNAEINGMAGHITTLRADATDHVLIHKHAPYDLLLCNVSAEWIIAHLHALTALTHQDSLLVFSGIQRVQHHMMAEQLTGAGLALITPLAQGEWCAMIASHEPTTRPNQ